MYMLSETQTKIESRTHIYEPMTKRTIQDILQTAVSTNTDNFDRLVKWIPSWKKGPPSVFGTHTTHTLRPKHDNAEGRVTITAALPTSIYSPGISLTVHDLGEGSRTSVIVLNYVNKHLANVQTLHDNGCMVVYFLHNLRVVLVDYQYANGACVHMNNSPFMGKNAHELITWHLGRTA
jgi:hypothetical protein